MSTIQIIFLVFGAIVGGGGLATYLKIRPERELLTGQAAKALTETATMLIEPLRRELAESGRQNTDLRERIARLELLADEALRVTRGKDDRIARQEEHITSLEEHITNLEVDNARLRERVSALESSLIGPAGKQGEPGAKGEPGDRGGRGGRGGQGGRAPDGEGKEGLEADG